MRHLFPFCQLLSQVPLSLDSIRSHASIYHTFASDTEILRCVSATLLHNLMRMKLTWTLLLIICWGALQAQDTTYYDSDWDLCDKPDASYYRLGQEQGGSYTFSDYYLDEGKLQGTGAYQTSKQETRIGTWRSYHKNGQMESEVIYEDGLVSGVRKRWHESGQLILRQQVDGDLPIGKWEEWYPDGTPRLLAVFQEDGQIVGEAKRWFESGNLAEDWVFRNRTSTVKTYYPDGSPQLVGRSKPDGLLDIQDAWDADGNAQISKGNGEWTWYRADGAKVATGTYRKGLPHGTWSLYHLLEEGSDQVQYQGTMKRGLPVDQWTCFREEGSAFITVPSEMIADPITGRIHHMGPQPREVMPAPLNMDAVKKAIGYPKRARNQGIEGQVIVRVLISRDGTMEKVRMIQEVHPLLDDAVMAQLDTLYFASAVQQGENIRFWVNIPFNFRLLR